MDRFKHFSLSNTSVSHRYIATGGGSGTFRSPPRDSRSQHGNKLLGELQNARSTADEAQSEVVSEGITFLPIRVSGNMGEHDNKKLSGIDLDKLDSKSKGIRVVNVREEEDRQVAIVAIPNDQLDYFEKKFSDYLDPAKDRAHSANSDSKPLNQRLVESIESIQLAKLRDYYTDSDQNPPEPDETIWWEAWLESLSSESDLEEFKSSAKSAGIEFSKHAMRFPEVCVVIARGSFTQWASVQGLLKNLAELRRAKLVSSEFVEMPPSDQADYVEDLVNRTSHAAANSPVVCLLDTGVNRGHPLLQPAIAEDSTLAWKEDWNVADLDGHGTEIAGVALYGPRLQDLLLGKEPVELKHGLESVKVLPDSGVNEVPEYGVITTGSMQKAEVALPGRNRVFCMTVTADDRDEFLPTSWSASIDQAIAGDSSGSARIFVVSAGNLREEPGRDYPDRNHLASVEDPAQSWNAITVGAHTELCTIQDADFDGWSPIARYGGLSPTSRTSVGWSNLSWPIKPEVVLEGGNYAMDSSGEFSDVPDLSLLTTRLDSSGALLGLTRATSPAAGQAARMCAIIQASYPDYWPETVRGLLIHGAEWTTAMESEFPRVGNRKVPKSRLRAYGWGVPSAERSIECARNRATMVIEDTIQPYCYDHNQKPATNEVNFHALPIPKEELEAIGDEEVEMRVTLSYFIEPSPGRKGWNVKHRYASHGLRFEVIRPLEDVEQFQKRISRDFWDGSAENEEKRVRPESGPNDDRDWILGEFAQTKGSIHSDFWLGSASQLAASGSIAVFPVTGWWKERPGQECVEKQARYSLIVTIKSKKADIDIYNWVASEIGVPVEVEIEG